MQSEKLADQTPTPGRDEDHVPSEAVAPLPQPGHENGLIECAKVATSSQKRTRLVEAAFERAATGLALVSPQGRWSAVRSLVLELVQALRHAACAGTRRAPPLDELALSKQHLFVAAALRLGQHIRTGVRVHMARAGPPICRTQPGRIRQLVHAESSVRRRSTA